MSKWHQSQMYTGLTPAWKIPCKHSIQSRYLYKIQLRFVYSIFREKFTGNQTTSHLLAYSSIIICLNGVFIKCVLCYSRKFLLRFVVFLIFVHYLTFGRGLHLKNTQLTHNNRTNFSNDCERIEQKKPINYWIQYFALCERPMCHH